MSPCGSSSPPVYNEIDPRPASSPHNSPALLRERHAMSPCGSSSPPVYNEIDPRPASSPHNSPALLQERHATSTGGSFVSTRPVLDDAGTGSSSEDDTSLENFEVNLSKFPTSAIATEGENSAPSSSDEGFESASIPVASPTTPQAHRGQVSFREGPAGQIRQRRRTRAERAARDARWHRAVPLQSRAIEVIDIIDSSDDEVRVVRILPPTMNPKYLDEYDQLTAKLRRTGDPKDADELIVFAQALKRRAGSRRRTADSRQRQKERQQQLEMDEMRGDIDDLMELEAGRAEAPVISTKRPASPGHLGPRK
ncbi:hypothetical protein QAD02_019559 [Eretmocerus hayati]|uniref:Uncharacterized protein n=1 Tax=Eretmocerus hayati TaxID=131215 RepID=A0ACC2PK66_9HYME|nr:hypothetical protein QAD02_019559 [Eretmocerus hayati]